MAVLAATGGILLLGEPLTPRFFFASIAVLAGIALVVTSPFLRDEIALLLAESVQGNCQRLHLLRHLGVGRGLPEVTGRVAPDEACGDGGPRLLKRVRQAVSGYVQASRRGDQPSRLSGGAPRGGA